MWSEPVESQHSAEPKTRSQNLTAFAEKALASSHCIGEDGVRPSAWFDYSKFPVCDKRIYCLVIRKVSAGQIQFSTNRRSTNLAWKAESDQYQRMPCLQDI